MRSRPVAAILLTLAFPTAACQLLWSYDDFKDKPGATSSSGSASSGSLSSSSGSGGSGGSASSSSTSSSGGCVDAGNPCDCDGDGDNAQTPECDFDGGDCNDHDPLVNSKQKKWFYDAGSNGWDYNCSNSVEFEHTGPIHCPVVIPCNVPPQYLAAPPSCGEAGAYAVCVQMGFGCVSSNEKGLLTQGCH